MKQKGFATIFGLCLILILALVVKGIQEAEANHAREVLNFEMEQMLQSAAESGIVEVVETGTFKSAKENKFNETTIKIKIDVKQADGKIYIKKKGYDGVYLMSYASTESPFLTKKIYRRAYGYVLDADDRKKIYFMELPTQ